MISSQNAHNSNSQRSLKTDKSINNGVIQFFANSSSEFSESNYSGRYIEILKEQIILQNDAIFETLKETLLPVQDYNQFNKIDHIIHRAQILNQESLPEFVKIVNRSDNTEQNMRDVTEMHYNLKNLINNYHSYKAEELSYDDFFNKYGATENHNFKKEKSNAETVMLNILGDEIKIINNDNPKLFNSANSQNLKSCLKSTQNTSKARQIEQMKQQVIKYKQRQKFLTQLYQNELVNQQRLYQQRIKNIIKILTSEQNNKKQLIGEELANNIDYMSKKTDQIHNLSVRIQQLEEQNNRLHEMTKRYEQNEKLQKKLLCQGSKQNISSRLIISSKINDNKQIDAKTCKVLNRLQSQNVLLKNQLKKIRKDGQLLNTKCIIKLKQQKNLLIKKVKNLEQQQRNYCLELDKLKIQQLQFFNQNTLIKKSLQIAKSKPITNITNTSHNNQPISTQLTNLKMLPEICKYMINKNGQKSEQQNPFYQLLSKQFRIRYKRCCLKQKDLLFKNDGLEVGVISELEQPNRIRIIVHFSNCSNQKITDLKIKIGNNNGNQIETDRPLIKQIQVGDQKKCGMKLKIKNYPICCTILTYSYKIGDKQEQVKLLLPTNIYKMLKLKHIDGQFIDPKVCKINSQRKIIKQFGVLAEYFKGASIDQQSKTIQASIVHQHTQTKLLMTLKYIHENCYEIRYQHRSGQLKLTQQIINSIKFLISKQ